MVGELADVGLSRFAGEPIKDHAGRRVRTSVFSVKDK